MCALAYRLACLSAVDIKVWLASLFRPQPRARSRLPLLPTTFLGVSSHNRRQQTHQKRQIGEPPPSPKLGAVAAVTKAWGRRHRRAARRSRTSPLRGPAVAADSIRRRRFGEPPPLLASTDPASTAARCRSRLRIQPTPPRPTPLEYAGSHATAAAPPAPRPHPQAPPVPRPHPQAPPARAAAATVSAVAAVPG